VHFTNVGKYEHGEAVPAADILNRIDKALDVTTDYLLNGTLQDKSADAISDEELVSQFRKIEKFPDDKKKLVKKFLDAFIFKADLQKQLAS
jgi:transcriptional regulator with XRE-family HTH domain